MTRTRERFQRIERAIVRRRRPRATFDTGLKAPIPALASEALANPLVTPLATLLSRHVIRDGELILLILKPSRWYIAISSIRFAAIVTILLIGVHLHRQIHMAPYIEAGVFCIAGRLMWAALNWMGRLYILTDQRIVRLSGVFSIEIFDCPLRKVSRTRLIPNLGEGMLRVGSIEIFPHDECRPCGVWQTIARPGQINEQINAAIRRAKTP